jgi:hypothetical protein
LAGNTGIAMITCRRTRAIVGFMERTDSEFFVQRAEAVVGEGTGKVRRILYIVGTKKMQADNNLMYGTIRFLCSRFGNGSIPSGSDDCTILGNKLKLVWSLLNALNRDDKLKINTINIITTLVIFHLYLIRKLGILHPRFRVIGFLNSDLDTVAKKYKEAKKHIDEIYVKIPDPDNLSFLVRLKKEEGSGYYGDDAPLYVSDDDFIKKADVSDAVFIKKAEAFITEIKHLIVDLTGEECIKFATKIKTNVRDMNDTDKKMAYQWFYIFNIIHGIDNDRVSYVCETMRGIPFTLRTSAKLLPYVKPTEGGKPAIVGYSKLHTRCKSCTYLKHLKHLKHRIHRKTRRRTRRSK